MNRFVSLAGLAGLFAAAPAVAQDCAGAPGAPGSATARSVTAAADAAYVVLVQEGRGSPAQRDQLRRQRERQFGDAARMHWRWTCDFSQRLASKPPHRALALVQGVVLFDLAEDVANMRRWHGAASAQVHFLATAGTAMPSYRSERIDRLLVIAEGRFNQPERKGPPIYFCVGYCPPVVPVVAAPVAAYRTAPVAARAPAYEAVEDASPASAEPAEAPEVSAPPPDVEPAPEAGPPPPDPERR